ncbi:MAG: hypothetical protein WD342_07390 [Verrucomicrobiales bacterium]
MNRPFRLSLETLPWLLSGYCVVALHLSPRYFRNHIVAKDSEMGAGFVENMTVVVLVVGIASGIAVLWRYRHLLSFRPRLWILIWTLGCVYFAGEEISWGQWAFGWSTPEPIADLNKQEETNLHNMSSWLNEKPRALVEAWVVFSGLFVPIARGFGRLRFPDSDWREWINPCGVGISASLVFLFSKLFEEGDSLVARALDSSETRELLVAYFLSIYLLSVYLKLRGKSKSTPAEAENRASLSAATQRK